MRPFDRFLVLLAAAFAMLAWLTARRAADASATSPKADRARYEPPVRLGSGKRTGNWPQPSWN